MNKYREEFLRTYGYRPTSDELADFMAEEGYNDFNGYESAYRYGPSESPSRPSYRAGDERDVSDAGDVSSEFSGLFRDILHESKQHKKVKVEGEEIINEFSYMLLLFLLKTSLYFVLRYCDERGFCTDL